MTTAEQAFHASPYQSIKYTTYFPVYDALIKPFAGKSPVLVEIGVRSGGSLFMWRELLGPDARIIGVEMNPHAEKWRDHGFEIFLGDQSDPAFWERFYAEVGPIDILLDDGGHTNRQMIQTVVSAIPNTRDGGVVIIEDVHCCYMAKFANPHPYSFTNFAKRGIDLMNRRFFDKRRQDAIFSPAVWRISFFESIAAFHIDRRLAKKPEWAENSGELAYQVPEYRYGGKPADAESYIARKIRRRWRKLKLYFDNWKAARLF